MAVQLKLTEREKAIARGEDPDALGTAIFEEPIAEVPDDGEEDSQEAGEEGFEDRSEEDAEEVSEEDSQEVSEEESVTEEVDEKGWLTDSVRELADSYGFSEQELSEFGSLAEFNRAGRLFDRALLRRPKEEEPKAQDPPPAEPPSEFKPPIDEGLFSEYGDNEMQMVRAVNEQAREIESLRAWKQQMEQYAQEQQFAQFHRACDELNPELFGKAFDEHGNVNPLSNEAHKQREKLYDVYRIMVDVASKQSQQGQQFPNERILLQRAYNAEFPEVVHQTAVSKRVSAAKSQASRKRQVGRQGGAKAPEVAVNPHDAKSIANHPSIVKLFERFDRENGAA